MTPGIRTSEAKAAAVALGIVGLVAAMDEPSWQHVALAGFASLVACVYARERTRLKANGHAEHGAGEQERDPPA